MSKGPWKDRLPEDEPEESRLVRIAELYLDLAANDLKRAQLEGTLAEHFRTASKQQKGTPLLSQRSA